MSSLSDRINNKHPVPATYRPSYKDYGPIKEHPVFRIQITTGGIGYDEALVTADGAMIPNTSPGQWGQLYAAGRY